MVTETKKKSYILGIDPGINGALALLHIPTNQLAHVIDIPIIASGVKDRKTININALTLVLSDWADDIQFCVFEDVHSQPRDGAVGAFSFGKVCGILLGVCGSLMIPVYPVPPQVWKGVFGLSSDKDESRYLASRKFPESKDMWKLKKHDGRAEAALLAEFGKRFY